MKKTITTLFLIIFCFASLSASFVSRVSLSEEVAYQRYNRIWTSPTTHYYSVESIASNPTLCNDFDIMFTKNVGLTLGTKVGYQWSIWDGNRFVSFPKNINGTVNAGLSFVFNNIRFSLSAMLRSSFQTSRNAWVSQLGGDISLSYALNNGLFFELGCRYLYSYEMITSGVSLGIGYQVGGKK
ncbi:MAG: hypothetical protein PUD65_00035 [Spirochaetales bacterium]|nr:hypothetical protein [Spirochaetales bacterium]